MDDFKVVLGLEFIDKDANCGAKSLSAMQFKKGFNKNDPCYLAAAGLAGDTCVYQGFCEPRYRRWVVVLCAGWHLRLGFAEVIELKEGGWLLVAGFVFRSALVGVSIHTIGVGVVCVAVAGGSTVHGWGSWVCESGDGKERELEWGRVKAITVKPVLRLPDVTMPFELHTDASDFTIGGVQMQDEHSMAFESRKLNEMERKYTVKSDIAQVSLDKAAKKMKKWANQRRRHVEFEFADEIKRYHEDGRGSGIGSLAWGGSQLPDFTRVIGEDSGLVLHLTRRLSEILWKVQEGFGSPWKIMKAFENPRCFQPWKVVEVGLSWSPRSSLIELIQDDDSAREHTLRYSDVFCRLCHYSPPSRKELSSWVRPRFLGELVRRSTWRVGVGWGGSQWRGSVVVMVLSGQPLYLPTLLWIVEALSHYAYMELDLTNSAPLNLLYHMCLMLHVNIR
ncbi:reverse transcriptase [Tanacetum coccineum]|uniref:Reverse transcriptase n=1 Tax=Tanacetum coccineum TaxID=301880 RepID=A0ABQ5BT72_9ASTR